MTFTSLGENYVWFGMDGCWTAFGQLTCDFCDATVDGEVGELDETMIFKGWIHDRVLNRDCCPDCRHQFGATRESRA